MKKEYHVLGGMAGSSMDGLDLAFVNFKDEGGGWSFELLDSITIAYPVSLHKRLQDSPQMTLDQQDELDRGFGAWIADEINSFLGDRKVELSAIHGHTVVHDPAKGISWQLGMGDVIARETGLTAITDFRTQDIQLGGQGAPLVPFGDFELFSRYDACLNLGGIANISIKSQGKAGDISPCNQVLNYFANRLDHDFDKGGQLAREGKIDSDFRGELDEIPFFRLPFPKSLPNAFISEELLRKVDPVDGLRTYTEFVAEQVLETLLPLQLTNPQLLVTGGGAFNDFLIEKLVEKLQNWQVVVPSPELVSFKEAIIFGFLGLMKIQDKPNVLRSVTGATADTSSGVIHLPK